MTPGPYSPAHGPPQGAPAAATALWPLGARFHATASMFDTSMDDRMFRRMTGLVGEGTVEAGDGVLRFTARRHHYGLNFGVGLTFGVIAAGLTIAAGVARGDGARAVESSWAVLFLGTVMAAAITATANRWRKPEAVLVERSRIRSAKLFGPRLRLFIDGGDVEMWFHDRNACFTFMNGLAGWGIPVR